MIYTISKELLSACGRGIAQGKKSRDIILKDYPGLSSYTGKYLSPDILHACTDDALDRNLRGIPNVRITEERNSRNYSFLQIETEHFYMTTSYVDQITTVPRGAHFRCVRAMSNQLFLFQEDQLPQGKPYLVLTHGLIEKKREGEVVFEELFGGIGMPCGDEPTRWNDNEFLPLTDYIDLARTIPEETIDELSPGFLKLRNKFLGNVDNNDSA